MSATVYQIQNREEDGLCTYGVYVARAMHSDNSHLFSRIYVDCIPLNTRLNYREDENDVESSGYLDIDYEVWTITDDSRTSPHVME